MDPVSILGLAATAGTIASTIAKTIRDLSDLRSQYTDANVRIRLLIQELSTIKSALNQINDWAHFLDDTHNQAELKDALQVALDGVELAMGALAEEVQALVEDTTHLDKVNLPFRAKSKFAWKEQNMMEHENRLRAQVSALQLLLQASQWYLHTNSRPTLASQLTGPQCIKTGASGIAESTTKPSHHSKSRRRLHHTPRFHEHCGLSQRTAHHYDH